MSLAEKLKAVIVEEMKRRADQIGFKEFDADGCFEQLSRDMEHGNGVYLDDFLNEIEKYINVWEMDTKTNCVGNP